MNATDPMKPTELQNLTMTDLKEKFYDHPTSSMMSIPRSLLYFGAHEWNNSTNPNNAIYPDYIIHNQDVLNDILAYCFLTFS